MTSESPSTVALLEAATCLLGVGSASLIIVDNAAGDQEAVGALRLCTEIAGLLKNCGEELVDMVLSAPEDGLARALAAQGIGSFVAARLPSEPTAFLCAYDVGAKTISPAQRHVLQTLAAAITLASDLNACRIAGDEARANGEIRDERLRFFESIVTNTNDAVLVTAASPTDAPGPTIRYVNPAFSRMTGYSLDDVLGKTPRILQGPKTSVESQARLHAALSAWKPIEIELLNYRKNGTPFHVELSIVPVADATGWYTHWVSVQRDVTKRTDAELLRAHDAEELNVELAYLAFHDDLTNLRNRAYFLERLSHTLKRARAPMPRQAALLFIDLDAFKTINDTLGHATGDSVLVETARRLTMCVRPGDLLARMGGDEFAILVDNITESSEVTAVAERILNELRAPMWVAGQNVFIHASMGISYVDARYVNSEEILQNADSAMYRAKRDGGMRYFFFDEDMHARAVAAIHLEKELRHAIERGELVVFYQPVVDIATGAIDGLEALVRWEHPERGLVNPSEFIYLAEETGMIADIGSFVLRTACADMHRWHDIAPTLTLSVNVSPRQFYDATFIDKLTSVLADSKLAPETLQLEITETIFLDRAEYVGALFARIRALGVRFALDDFGTGYSSLSYLERFSLDTLKIDQAFTSRTTESDAGLAIVRAIVDLARALDMRVVGEGVETTTQLEALRTVGCDLVQGYLFSHPLPATSIASLLEGNGNRRSRWAKALRPRKEKAIRALR